uniref:Uncharacterized protein n=1 Tax=Photinus pyralis TaxID=7054 RepID=A0A1Y1L8J4_PHOPY
MLCPNPCRVEEGRGVKEGTRDQFCSMRELQIRDVLESTMHEELPNVVVSNVFADNGICNCDENSRLQFVVTGTRCTEKSVTFNSRRSYWQIFFHLNSRVTDEVIENEKFFAVIDMTKLVPR